MTDARNGTSTYNYDNADRFSRLAHRHQARARAHRRQRVFTTTSVACEESQPDGSRRDQRVLRDRPIETNLRHANLSRRLRLTIHRAV